MSDKERGIQLSRRRLLQLPIARSAGSLDTIAKVARVAEVAIENPATTQRFFAAVRNIFQPFPRLETPQIFRDRPEEIELSSQDKAINAVTDLLQPHEQALHDWNLDPATAIEHLAEYLDFASQITSFRGAVVMAESLGDNHQYRIYELRESYPTKVGYNDFCTAAHFISGHVPDPLTPAQQYAADILKLVNKGDQMYWKGPYMTETFSKVDIEGKGDKELTKAFSDIDRRQLFYLGTLLPIK